MQAVVMVAGGFIGNLIAPGVGWKWGMALGSMLGGYLYPPSSKAGPNKVAGLNVTAPAKGQVLPVVYGKTRVAGSIIWFGNFQSHDAGSGGASGGGAKGSGQETYTASVAIALGEGIVGSLNAILAGDDDVTADTTYTWHTGTVGQAVDAHMQAYLEAGQPDLTYPGVAYCVLQDFDLGYSSSLPNFNFIVTRTTANLVTGNSYLTTLGLNTFTEDANGDLNPVVCLADFLTHPKYGLAVPVADVDAASWQEIAQWCADEGLYCSPVLDTAQRGLGHVEELLSYFDGLLVYSQGLFKLRSRRSPAREAVDYAVVDWRDWLRHPTLSRAIDQQIANVVSLEYSNRAANYNTAVVERSDDWDVGTRGAYREQISLPGVKTAAVADMLASKMLWARIVGPQQIEMGLGPQAAWFEPGDLLLVKGSEFYAIRDTLYRVVSISEDPNGEYTVSAVEER